MPVVACDTSDKSRTGSRHTLYEEFMNEKIQVDTSRTTDLGKKLMCHV